MTRSLVRFFQVVSPHPMYIRLGFAAVVAIGAWSLWLNPNDSEGPLASVLLLQMFASSTGFAAAANRGHYDAVLVGPLSRVRIALAHWLVSAAPGACAWLVLAAVEFLLSGRRMPDALAPHGIVALLLVSAVAWTFTLPLPRLSGGAAWVLLLLMVAVTREDAIPAARAIVSAPAEQMPGIVESVRAFTVCPFLLLTRGPAARRLVVLIVEACFALGALAGGIAYVARREYPLVQRL